MTEDLRRLRGHPAVVTKSTCTRAEWLGWAALDFSNDTVGLCLVKRMRMFPGIFYPGWLAIGLNPLAARSCPQGP